MSVEAVSDDTTERLQIFEAATEATKYRLMRFLHDDVGGLLGGAVMDVVWAEGRALHDSKLLERLKLVKESLTKAVVIQRQVIEELCPTLIENVGLMAALRWYHRQQCLSSKIHCHATYPERETPFLPPAAKTLFRVFEEAFVLVCRQRTATSARVAVDTSRSDIIINVQHDGDVIIAEQRSSEDLTSLWLVEHRVRGLGGYVTVTHPATGGMKLTASVPLEGIVAG